MFQRSEYGPDRDVRFLLPNSTETYQRRTNDRPWRTVGPFQAITRSLTEERKLALVESPFRWGRVK